MKRISIVLLAGCLVPVPAHAQATLSYKDSANIALMIAESVTPQLRSASGADSTNAVCVRVDGPDGTLMRALNRALHARTGGPIVAPVSISPLRAVIIDNFTTIGDTAWVKWRTTGGQLHKGGMRWSHSYQWRLVRQDSSWIFDGPQRGTMGDGYIRADLPHPPDPPSCLRQ